MKTLSMKLITAALLVFTLIMACQKTKEAPVETTRYHIGHTDAGIVSPLENPLVNFYINKFKTDAAFRQMCNHAILTNLSLAGYITHTPVNTTVTNLFTQLTQVTDSTHMEQVLMANNLSPQYVYELEAYPATSAAIVYGRDSLFFKNLNQEEKEMVISACVNYWASINAPVSWGNVPLPSSTALPTEDNDKVMSPDDYASVPGGLTWGEILACSISTLGEFVRDIYAPAKQIFHLIRSGQVSWGSVFDIAKKIVKAYVPWARVWGTLWTLGLCLWAAW
jgi:hypothetical protein